MNAEYRNHLSFLLIVAAIILTAGLGLRDPWPADEPRFALIARDMAESGNWLLPYVGGVIYPDKPPLFFWLVAALYAVTGSLRVAFLLPGVIAGLGTLLLVTDLARRLWDTKTAIWCGATLLALVQFPLQMKSGQIDGLLCLWTTLGLYGLSRHLLLGPDWRWYAIGGLSAGLGVITKGVGFLPYLIFIPYIFAAHRSWPVLRHTWRDVRWFLAPLASLLAIGIWLVPMLVVTSGSADPDLLAYRDNILFHQTVTRYADSWGHIRPPWYLFTNAATWLWLPVSFLLPWLIVSWRRDLREKVAPILLLGSWVLLVLLFFSISAGKRSLYIFPASPALALIAGYHARELLQRVGVQRILVGVPAFLAITLIAIAMYALMNPHDIERWTTDIPTLIKASVSSLLIGILILTTIVVCRRRRVLVGYPVAMLIFWVGAGMLVAPSIDAIRSGRALIQGVEERIDSHAEVGFVAWPEQFLLQWNKPVTHFGYRRDDAGGETQDAVWWISAGPDRHILLPEHRLEPCFDISKVVPVGKAHRRNWVIADKFALSDSCFTQSRYMPKLVVQYMPSGHQVTAGRLSTASSVAQ